MARVLAVAIECRKERGYDHNEVPSPRPGPDPLPEAQSDDYPGRGGGLLNRQCAVDLDVHQGLLDLTQQVKRCVIGPRATAPHPRLRRRSPPEPEPNSRPPGPWSGCPRPRSNRARRSRSAAQTSRHCRCSRRSRSPGTGGHSEPLSHIEDLGVVVEVAGVAGHPRVLFHQVRNRFRLQT
jgi:hypothetical protein